MKFSERIKCVSLTNYYKRKIKIDNIKAQYNPDRFKYWKSLHLGPPEEVLNMRYSPHYRYLSGWYYSDRQPYDRHTSYYKLQKMYGRNDHWIVQKIIEFNRLLHSIDDNGFQGEITVLSKPLVENPYNSGFEIFEGHHRLTACLVCGMIKIPCKVVRI